MQIVFFARSIVEQHHLRSSVNISRHLVQDTQSVKRLLSNENAFHFMSSVKDAPAYWRQFFHEVMALVKQLGIPTYFLTLPCADLRRDKLPHIINRLNNLNLTDEVIRNLTYQQRIKFLNDR